MNIALRALTILAVAGITVGVLWAVSQVQQVATVRLEEDKPPVLSHPTGIRGQNLGSAGCLAAACHGAPANKTLAGEYDSGTWESSGSCWVAADPHNAAYSLLTDHPYRQVKVTAAHIMKHYAKDTPGAKATDDARCLACHTNPALAAEGKTDDPRVLSLRAEGVSCEACHGSAGGWVRAHTTWKGDRGKVYAETGMHKLYDLGERALACAGCHVGAPAEGNFPVRDMNHDMIAAGHPRLNFDFAEYQRRLPIHWQEKDRTSGTPRGREDLKTWLVGRVAHAEAACKLTNDRAERSKTDSKSPWPEFAEFNCAACHHHLRAPKTGDKVFERENWRDDPAVLAARPIGVPAWQAVWPVAPTIGLTPHQPDGLFAKASAKPLPAVLALAKAMEGRRPTGTAKAQQHAQPAAAALTALRVELVAWPEAEFAREASAAFATLTPAAEDWDSGLQLLFGLAALERSRPRDEKRLALFRDAFGAYRGPPAMESERWQKMDKAIKQLHPKQ